MSQNVTLLACVSPVQSLAIEALAGGSNVTAAAKAAGVTRETVSRWMHHDPVFITELHNIQVEMATQTRCALEALGMRSIETLSNALQNNFVQSTALRAACAVLKILGANRAETLEPTTPQEVQLRLREREQKLQERQAKLDASEANAQAAAVTPEREPAGTEEVTTEAEAIPAAESEPAGESVARWAVGSGQWAEAAASVPASSAADEPVAREPAQQVVDSAAAQVLRHPSAAEPTADRRHDDSAGMSPANDRGDLLNNVNGQPDERATVAAQAASAEASPRLRRRTAQPVVSYRKAW